MLKKWLLNVWVKISIKREIAISQTTSKFSLICPTYSPEGGGNYNITAQWDRKWSRNVPSMNSNSDYLLFINIIKQSQHKIQEIFYSLNSLSTEPTYRQELD